MAHRFVLLLFAFVSTTSSTAVPPCEDPTVSEHFGGVNNEAYLTWARERGDVTYNVSAYFASTGTNDTTQGAALYWKVEPEYVRVAFAARATGWIGFGIAEAGGMKGSDIVYYESSNPGQLTDAYANDKAMPIADDCQDWSFVDARQEGGFLIVEGVRRLDTLDGNDYAIIHDEDTIIAAQRLIFAWGDSESISYHGPHTARGGIRWYGDGDEIASFRHRMNATAEGYFDVFASNYPIKPVETDYVDFCFTWSDFLDQGVPADGSISVIGAEMILDVDGGRFVHHATIAGTTKPSNESLTCFDSLGEYNYPLYGWAPGTLPFAMPEDVGFSLGPGENGNGIQGFRINMHYNNPQLIEGPTDSGGLRVYYVRKPLKHEAGLMFMADPFTHLKGTPLGDGLSEFSFDCEPGCSSLALDEPVTVIQEFFHMHMKGTGAIQMQIRDGEVIRQARTNYFDFAQSGIHGVRQQSYRVLPGDSFRTQCIYSSSDDTVFGIASTDEMCEGLFLYYPAKRVFDEFPWGCVYDVPVSVCNASLSYSLLPYNTSSFRTFGTSEAGSGQCSAKLPVAKSSAARMIRSWFLWLTTSATFLLFSVG
jgi:DOMON domain/Copper type II ascorbate-dependent monooxygenase, C-terminal domain